MLFKKSNSTKSKSCFINEIRGKEAETIEITVTVASNHDINAMTLERLQRDIENLSASGYKIKKESK